MHENMRKLVIIWLMAVAVCLQGVGSVTTGKDSYVAAYLESEIGSSPGVVYGEPAHPSPAQPAPLDHAKSTLLPQALKILAIVLKIILKLTFFKIIVKFIAIICLFLFIPTLDFKSVIEDMMDHDGKSDGKEGTQTWKSWPGWWANPSKVQAAVTR